MASERKNKLLTVTLTPPAMEAVEALKKYYTEEKTSRVMDTVIKNHMISLGYQIKPEINTEKKMVEVEIISAGSNMTKHAHDGMVYFEAPESGEYIIRVRNNDYQRKEIVVSVDGLSVMDGEEASFEKRGYILGGYGIIDIKGWRRTSDDVASFEFTKTGESYSAKMGKGTDNVGVIGVAVFNEKQDYKYWLKDASWPMDNFYDNLGGNIVYGSGSQSMGGTFSSSTTTRSSSRRITKGTVNVNHVSSEATPETNIGTGYGKETSMKVTSVSFTRESSEPNRLTSFRYATRAKLVKWGVISKPVNKPNPFPGNKVASKAPPGWKG